MKTNARDIIDEIRSHNTRTIFLQNSYLWVIRSKETPMTFTIAMTHGLRRLM